MNHFQDRWLSLQRKVLKFRLFPFFYGILMLTHGASHY